MTDETDALIREIAAKHGIAVGRDDPILILQTLNQRLLADSAQAQQALVEQFRTDMDALAQRWDQEARAKAERVLNAALEASQAAMANLMQSGATAAAASVRAEIDAALAVANRHWRDTRRLVLLNLAAAALTLLAAALAWWARFSP
ncbi:MAG: conjugal transfer protein TraM [Methylococcus sp.]|nr:conjugal transfer protein TraM [Methylococcus sp.]